MLRETNVQTLHWADKTMSVLRARQLEACEGRLAALPDFGLFDGCDDSNVEELWRISFDAQEQPIPTALHTQRQLQAQVLTNLPAEAALLSPEEHQLMERMLALDGEAELLDWEESSAAEALARRLWCTVTREEDRIFVRLPQELMVPLRLITSSKAHEELRDKLYRYDATIRGLLYIGGLLHVGEPMRHLMADVLEGTYAANATLAMRYIRTTYDYTYDSMGQMLLLHPGLAEPDQLLKKLTIRPDTRLELDERDMLGAMSGLLPEEKPLFEMMFGLLLGAVRPEISTEEAVDDLRMLAKQGVSLSEMNDVLGTLLTVQPTSAMLDGVARLHIQTPRWGTMHTGVVQ